MQIQLCMYVCVRLVFHLRCRKAALFFCSETYGASPTRECARPASPASIARLLSHFGKLEESQHLSWGSPTTPLKM
jgi:hypothetical protein